MRQRDAGRLRLAGPRTWVWGAGCALPLGETRSRVGGRGGGGGAPRRAHSSSVTGAHAEIGGPPAQCGRAAAPPGGACGAPAAHSGSAWTHSRGVAARRRAGQSGVRRQARGGGMSWRWGATQRAALLLVCSMAALAPRGASAQRYFNPMYIFGGQVLFLCNDPPRDDGSVPVECQNPYMEPELVTLGDGRLRACTHDTGIWYQCNDDSPGCSCFGNCIPNNGFPPECLDVVFALEDTWAYLGIHIEHGPGRPGEHIPFTGYPSYHLLFRLTVHYGELDLLDTLRHCTWETPDQDPSRLIKETCDVPPTSLPEGYGDIFRAPYHIRYTRYIEQNFVATTMALELSGFYELIDPLIRLVRYKARPNENSFRIKSPIYNQLSSRMVPNELLQIDVFNLIQAGSGRPSTDRYGY